MKHIRMTVVISCLGLASLLLISTTLLFADTQNEPAPPWAVGTWDLDVMTPKQGGTQSIVLHVKPGGAIKYDGATKGVVFTRSTGGLGFVSGSGHLRYASFNEPYDVVSILTGGLRADGTGSGTCGVCDSRTSEVSTFTWTAQRRGDPTEVTRPADEVPQIPEQIRALIEQPGPLIQIECKFVEIQKDPDKPLAMDWQDNPEQWLREQLVAGKAELLNSPHIATRNGVPAEVEFRTEIPYFYATISYDEFGQRTVDYETDTVSVGQSISVTPTIQADGQILMGIDFRVDGQVGTVVGPNGEVIPIVTTQSGSLQSRVADGETLVISGISVSRQATLPPTEGPVITGELFRQRLAAEQNKELLIFVTPRILSEIPPQ